MRNLKKVLALVLTLAMMLSVMVMNTGAAFADQSDIDGRHTEAVDNCVALSIINGYDNKDGTFSFKPNGDVTRAQMAKMICIAVNGGKEPMGGSASAATFSDVPNSHWAFKYVEYCFSSKYIDGTRAPVIDAGNNVTEQGAFSPDKQVTGSQAAKMLLTALGYDSVKEGFTGSAWEVNVNAKASAVGLYENLEDIDASAPLSREHAAEMIWNALGADTVSYNRDTGRVEKGASGQNEWYGTSDTVFLLSKIDYSSKNEYLYSGYLFNTDTGMVERKDGAPVASTQFKSKVDYSGLYGQVVKAMADGKDLTGLAAEKSKVIVEGILGDIDEGKTPDKLKVNGTEYKVDTKMTEMYAYAGTSYEVEADDICYDADLYGWMSFKAIDNDDNGKIDTVVVFETFPGKVKTVSKTEVKLQNAPFVFAFEDDDIYDGVARDDWAMYTLAACNTTDQNKLVKADVVSGEVSSTRGSVNNSNPFAPAIDGYKVKIDGTWYRAAIPEALTIGEEYELVVYNGYYFNVDQISSDLAVAVVTGIGSYDRMEETLAVRLLFADGSEEIVNVEKWVEADAGTGDPVEIDLATGGMKDVMVAYDEDDDLYTLATVGVYEEAVADTAKTNDFVASTSSNVKYDDDDACIYVESAPYDLTDDSVIFVKDKNDDYSVLTADQLLEKNGFGFNAKANNVAQNAYLALNTDDKEVGAMFGFADTAITSGDEVYGLVVDVNTAKDSDNDKTVLYLDVIIDGEKLVEVETDETDLKAVAIGDVITYTLDENDVMSDIEVVTDDFFADKVTKHTAKSVNLAYNGRYTIDKDTVVIAIDSSDEDDIQYVDSEIRDAEDDATLHNALFYSEDDSVITVIFIEVDDDCGFVPTSIPIW